VRGVRGGGRVVGRVVGCVGSVGSSEAVDTGAWRAGTAIARIRRGVVGVGEGACRRPGGVGVAAPSRGRGAVVARVHAA
jgi:hypothetical protein